MREDKLRGCSVWRSTFLAVVVCWLCFAQAWAASTPDVILIEDVPHVLQKPDFCGEACIAMVLQKLGYDVTQDHVFNLAGVDPMLARGCVTREMVAVLKKIGFRPGTVWYGIDPRQADVGLTSQWRALETDLRRGVPSIICMRTTDERGAAEHFRLILGYDAGSDEVIYHEPARENGAYQRMKRATFLDLWPLKYKPTEWLVIRMRLEAGRLSVGTPAAGLTRADFAQHMMGLKSRVPRGFIVVVQPPFVVIGDEAPAVVRRRAEKTVKWLCDQIRALYFRKDPPAIYDIWLFRDKESYRKYAKELFDDEPSTPFGYFSRANGALVMNIATGGGTLCHEIVHAFVASNFPDCPAWFNEGLASLYEQCSERNGRTVGLTNWRLAGLKKEIHAGTLPSFRDLLTTTTHQFYNASGGSNYAQARYLCYYLQERGLLVKYYHAFVKNAEADPSGYETLKQLLSIADDDGMTAFQRRWEQWVLKLRFP